MSSANPLISIITVTYNSEKYIEDVILSLKAQKYTNIEWIVVDGNSTDHTVDIIKQNMDIVSLLLCEPDEGMYDALNKGFEKARGEIGFWLNSDDIIFPWTCEVIASLFTTQKNCEWVTGLKCNIDKLGTPYPFIPVVYPRWLIKQGYCHGKAWAFIQQECTFFRMSLYKKAGGINKNYLLAGDFDLWKKMASHSFLYTIRVPLGGFRIHDNQLSHNVVDYYKEVSHSGGKNVKGLKVFTFLYSFFHFIISRSKGSIYVGRNPVS